MPSEAVQADPLITNQRRILRKPWQHQRLFKMILGTCCAQELPAKYNKAHLCLKTEANNIWTNSLILNCQCSSLGGKLPCTNIESKLSSLWFAEFHTNKVYAFSNIQDFRNTYCEAELPSRVADFFLWSCKYKIEPQSFYSLMHFCISGYYCLQPYICQTSWQPFTCTQTWLMTIPALWSVEATPKLLFFPHLLGWAWP